MASVGIVCDSTCDLGPEWFARHDVTMVPLKVLFGDETYRDWIDMSVEDFYKRLVSAPALPKTSQPSPADFASVYADLAASGVEEIVSIHLTSALSGTFDSATLAAADSPVPVRVVDTRTVSQATGLVVLAAVEARDAGGDAAAVEATASATAVSTRLFFILDTLDYLVKGGRAGKATGLAASVLNIKPILVFNSDGIIEPFKKVKGTRKAYVELAAHVAAETRRIGRVRLAMLYADRPEKADELRAELDAAGADYDFVTSGALGAVMGTYAGPGAVGVAYHPLG
ncbi:MAG: DegV family protein [Coriobacteriia bacterium]